MIYCDSPYGSPIVSSYSLINLDAFRHLSLRWFSVATRHVSHWGSFHFHSALETLLSIIYIIEYLYINYQMDL